VTGFTGAPEYRSVFAWPRPRTRQAEPPDGATLTGFSHQYDPDIRILQHPGLLLRLTSRRTSLPADQRSLSATSLYRSCRASP